MKTKTIFNYQSPSCTMIETNFATMLCGSTTGSINDLTEDTTTLGGLFNLD